MTSEPCFSAMERRKWEELKSDCLINIVNRLDPRQKALCIPLVCKSWYHISLNPACWTLLDFRNSFPGWWYDEIDITHPLKFSISHGNKLAIKIAFPNCLVCFNHLKLIAEDCPQLRYLHLPTLAPSDEDLLPSLLCNWNNLEVLVLGHFSSSFSIVVHELSIHCPRFMALKLTHEFNEADAHDLVKMLPNLKVLNLDGSVISRELLLIIIGGCKELMCLYARNCIGFDVDDEAILMKASHIKTFDCSGSYLEDIWDYGGISSKDVDGDYYSD